MCGVFGCFLDRPLLNGDRSAVRAGVTALSHRGPDGVGEWVSEPDGLILGHTRLSILDLTEQASQPMERAGFVIAFNGELYNFLELRDELAAKGYAFESQGDTEVVLQAWRCWGAGALERFDGMYAFALWDGQALHLVTDPFGEKPLFVARKADGLWFASEAQALGDVLRLSPSLGQDEVAAFLTLGFLPPPATGFPEMRCLPPATHTVLHRDGRESQDRYWQVPESEPGRGPIRPIPDSGLDRIQEVLIRSTERRVRSDVPLGIFLSSGTDSVLVAAMVAKDLGLDARALTVGYPDGTDETTGAAAIAEHLGLRHTVIDSQRDEQWRRAPERLLELYGVPNDNLTALSVQQMSALAREHVKVALSGIGGDEMFYGYGKYRFLYRHRHAYRLLGRLLEATRPLDGLLGRSSKWRQYADLLRGTPPWQFLALKNQPVGARLGQIPGAKRWARGLLPSNGRPLVYRVRDFDVQNTLPASYIAPIDRGSMRAGLEVRTPFLSRELAEVLAEYDPRTFLAFGQKETLRRIALRYVPAKMMHENKQGFVFPVARYLATRGETPPVVAHVPSGLVTNIWQRRMKSGYSAMAMRLAVLEAFCNRA